jgi:acetoin:2,6-dichlorophenolindophenol oxidoreductase subunit beta
MPNRNLTFGEAIHEAQHQAMSLDKSVFIFGQGVDKSGEIFGTTKGLKKTFGKNRVFDTPNSEMAQTALAGGAANAGMRPVLVHMRVDFMAYSFDQIINWISLWSFKSGGKSRMPLTIRGLIGSGWGQGPQHAKTLHSLFASIPGIRVVIPSSPSEAKGLLMASIFSNDPVIFLEYRSLYKSVEHVPQKPYFIELGTLRKRIIGKDITIVGSGSSILTALQVASMAKEKKISIEVLDLSCINSIDHTKIHESIKKTGRLIVLEDGWEYGGFASEIITEVAIAGIKLKSSPQRVSWSNSHVPMSKPLESDFYTTPEEVLNRCINMLGRN